jgi:hypothetical protein
LAASPAGKPVVIVAALAVALCGAGAALWVWRDRIFKPAPPPQAKTEETPKKAVAAAPRTVYPVPTNTTWTRDLSEARLPEMTAAGSIHGNGFRCERAVLEGGNLSLRQGKGWPPDLGISILLFAQQGEELSGKVLEIAPDRSPPLPRVFLRWKDDQQKGVRREFHGGYALKVAFGQAAGGRMPGKLYLSLPDEAESFVAGTFEAEIRKPAPPKPPQPKGGKQGPSTNR